jgi:glycosyltransferase involved in cell wall biosynthesis
MSNALLEAQSWGLAVVASDIPANRALVDDGINGLVVPVGDVDALAAAVIRLLDDAALRARLGRAARERVAREFAMDSVVDRLCALYDRLTSQQKG